MLVSSFSHEKTLMLQLIVNQEYNELEQRIHRMYGATRYIGLPQLQKVTYEFEQLLSKQRSAPSMTMEVLAQQVSDHFERLSRAMAHVEHEAIPLLNS